MSAPLFLVGPGTLADGTTTVHLDGPEGRHAADVQRLLPGEPVLLADGAGRVARCTVTGAHRGALDLSVEELRDEPEPAPRLVLVQALAKGDRDLLAVESATELDVDEVVPWQADRSIVRWRGERGRRRTAGGGRRRSPPPSSRAGHGSRTSPRSSAAPPWPSASGRRTWRSSCTRRRPPR